MLGDGQVEDFVGFKEGREDGPTLEHHAAQIHFAVEIGVGKNDFGALGAGSGLNAGALKAAARLVATDVGDDDALGAGLPALAHNLGDDLGIGVGGLLRGAIPGDVGLENHHVLAADEAANAAQVFEGPLHQGARFSTLHDGHLRQLRIGGGAMVTAGLLGEGRDRAETVFAQPYARSPRAGSYTSHAKQLQHGLAARKNRRLGLFLVRRTIGFPGHGHPPGQTSMRLMRCGSLKPNW